MARWQYLQFVQPLVDSQTTETRVPHSVYPDLVFRITLRATDHPAFTGLGEPPAPPFSWIPRYPDQIWRTVLPVGMPWHVLDPFPRPNQIATELSAWATYPDRIDRRILHPSLMPYHVPGPLEPIPNPVVAGVIDDKMHLGTKEALGITSQPTLGGWQAW